jgi:putative adhesin
MKTFVILLAAVAATSLCAQAAGAWPTVRHVDTNTYALSSTGSLSVDNASGDVQITGWDQSKVEVTEIKSSWSSDDLPRLQTQVNAQGDSLSLRADYPDDCTNCDITYHIRAPQGAHVTVDSAGGDVTVVSVSGPVRVESSSGDITVHDISGAAHLHTSSGSLTIDNATDAVEGDTSSGDIDASGLTANADLISASGDVKADFAAFAAVKNVILESTSGDVTIEVPRGTGFRVEASTGSGDIHSNLALPISERDSGADVDAQVGTGAAMVQLRATSGDIHVDMH